MWTQDVFLPSSQYPDIKAVNNQSEILPTLRHVANFNRFASNIILQQETKSGNNVSLNSDAPIKYFSMNIVSKKIYFVILCDIL